MPAAMGKRRQKRRASGSWLTPAVITVALVVAAALIWFIAGPSKPGPAPEFGAVLYELAATRGADPERISADQPIRKIDGVFVRSWQIAVPTRNAMTALEDDIVGAATTRGANITRGASESGDTARVRVDLGVEAFDVVLLVQEPPRIAELMPSATPTPQAEPTATPKPRPAPGARGRLGILLDDAGQSTDLLAVAVKLPDQVGVAVLPFLPHSAEIADAMHEGGHEVWLHLPMEPERYPDSDPGPGALLVGMNDSEIRSAVHAAINNVPHVVGVNNHMGSRATADLRVMTWVMQELHARNLGFIDSRTTRDTVAEEVARTLGVPCARRNVFLDNQRSTASIKKQLAEAVELCRIDGAAIAIGHLDPVTVKVLGEELPGLAKRGADLVPPSALLR
jgi:polysaccharide deacetylase 2 family uncharacterized protein YibQ